MVQYGLLFMLLLLNLYSNCAEKVCDEKKEFVAASRIRRFANDLPNIRYRFTGADGQYVKFRKWVGNTAEPLKVNEELTFSFEFRTKQANSVLLYLDDGGPSDFIAITLVNGVLHLRFKFGLPASTTLRSGFYLNDHTWHKVTLKRSQFSLTLIVDQRSTSYTVTGVGRNNFLPVSKTYLGGLPINYMLQSLSLPSIFYKKKFIGQMQQIMINGKIASRMGKYLVREESSNRPCSEGRNPCEHGGKCYFREGKILCDCTTTSYTGKFCDEKAKAAPTEAVATFRGSEWLSYDLTRKTVSSFDDEIKLSFKTRQPNGLLLHTGKSADYVTLAIKDGFVLLVVNLGSGAYEIVVQPMYNGKFNDGQWHTVRVNRTLREVNIVVDQANIHNHYVQEDYTQLTLDDVVYVGGSPDTASLPGTRVKNNFIGCLKEVSYSNTEGDFLPISRYAQERNSRVSVQGNIAFSCQEEINGLISFLSPESFLLVPLWNQTRRGLLQIKFRTTEENGVLLFASSNSGDMFAIELFQGNLFIVFNLGSGTYSFQLNSTALFSDWEWHNLNLNRIDGKVSTVVDGISASFRIAGRNTALDITGPMYLGNAKFPPQFSYIIGLKNSPIRKGFAGCVKDLRIDSVNVDLQSLASSSDSSAVFSADDIVPYCKSLGAMQCSSSPCKNGGECVERINRFQCDCSMTSFTGKTCNEPVVTSSFNGTQMMIIPLDKSMRTEAEEITLRFKTLISTGLLFGTSSNTSRDALKIQLVQGGQMQLYVNVGCSPSKNCTAHRQGPDTFFNGENLNDGRWHNVKMSRRGHRISLSVDGRPLVESIAGRHYTLEFDAIYVGMYPSTRRKRKRKNKSSANSPPFVGQIENLVFNKISVIDSCANRSLFCINNSTMRDTSYITAYSVSLPNENSYVLLPTLQVYRSMSLSLSFKTTAKEGLILYNGGKRNDYIAVELVEGLLYYVYSVGNGKKILSILGGEAVNDNKWHDLRITRSLMNLNVMTLDGQTSTLQGSIRNKNLDLIGNLYMGGASQDMFQNRNFQDGVVSRVGYQGCLANIDLNGKLVDLSRFLTPQSPKTSLKRCTAPEKVCQSGSCKNGGKCIQKWNDFVCDCSLTAYVGPNCNRHGTTFIFNSNEGVILFQWADFLPSRSDDKFAIGFSTTVRDSLLFKVTGSEYKRSRDFLELAIVKGKLTLVFNMGSSNVTLVEPRSVADGQYHKCVVHRQGMNATMRVDNWPIKVTSPDNGAARSRFERAMGSIPSSVKPTVDKWLKRKERANTVFSSQSLIQIGGFISKEDIDRFKSGNNPTPAIRRAFRGQMAGFFFNDVRVFDLAIEGDPRVSIIGNVQRVGSIPPTAPTYLSPTTTMTTETIFTTQRTLIDSPINDSGCEPRDMCENSSGATESGSSFVNGINDDEDDNNDDSSSGNFAKEDSSKLNDSRKIKDLEDEYLILNEQKPFKNRINFDSRITEKDPKLGRNDRLEDSNHYDEESESAFNKISSTQGADSVYPEVNGSAFYYDDVFSGFFTDDFSFSTAQDNNYPTEPTKSLFRTTDSPKDVTASKVSSKNKYSKLSTTPQTTVSPLTLTFSPYITRQITVSTVLFSDDITVNTDSKISASVSDSKKTLGKNTENITSSTPVVSTPDKETQSASISMIMIIGIAGGCIFILVILLLVMLCKKRDHVYNVNKESQKHEQAARNGKHVVVNSNGSVIKEKTTNLNNHDPNKEVLV